MGHLALVSIRTPAKVVYMDRTQFIFHINKTDGTTEEFRGTFEEVAWHTFVAHLHGEYDCIVTDDSGVTVCTRGIEGAAA